MSSDSGKDIVITDTKLTNQTSNKDHNSDLDSGVEKNDIRDYIRETRPWYKVPHLRKLSFMVFIITLTSTNNGFDGSLMNGLQSLKHWSPYFGTPTGQKLGALSNGPTFGCLLVFPFAPYIPDKFGRKWAIVLGQFLVLVGAIIQGASTGGHQSAYAMFLVSRMIIGIGSGLATVPAPSLISELSYPLHRDASTFSYNICWYLGATFSSIVTYLTRTIDNDASWRIPAYLQAFFPLLQICLIWLVPESPRFLIATGKSDKAREILEKYHVGGSTDPRDQEFIDFELSEIEAGLEAEKIAGADSKYTDFWTRKTYRKRLFLVLFTATMMQLSGNGLVSYYLNKVLNSIGITNLSKQLQINMCLMIYNLVVSFAVCCVNGFFKRRTLFLTCVCGMLVCYIVWTALSAVNQQRNFEQPSLGRGVLAMIFFYYLMYDIGANGLPYLYITEILPYSHRAKGINVFQFWMQVVLVYNGYVNPIAMDAIEWKYYIVYCCILAVECVIVYLFYPETSGRTLEEVAEVFGDLKLESTEAGYGFNHAHELKRETEHEENV